jgi:hypothetical protein
VTIAGTVFENGAVVDTRELTPPQLDALPGVTPSDSGAPQMQHMAVVRDFKISI